MNSDTGEISTLADFEKRGIPEKKLIPLTDDEAKSLGDIPTQERVAALTYQYHKETILKKCVSRKDAFMLGFHMGRGMK